MDGAAHPDDAAVVAARGDDVVVHVHVQPRAAHDAIVGHHTGALRLRVRAPAVDGRATEAARRLLARALGVAPSRVTLEAGARSRRKRFVVRGADAATVRTALAAAIGDPRPPRRSRS